jgi:hypothetical protein
MVDRKSVTRSFTSTASRLDIGMLCDAWLPILASTACIAGHLMCQSAGPSPDSLAQVDPEASAWLIRLLLQQRDLRMARWRHTTRYYRQPCLETPRRLESISSQAWLFWLIQCSRSRKQDRQVGEARDMANLLRDGVASFCS